MRQDGAGPSMNTLAVVALLFQVSHHTALPLCSAAMQMSQQTNYALESVTEQLEYLVPAGSSSAALQLPPVQLQVQPQHYSSTDTRENNKV